ncbi:MAG TPA: hypothetical protein ENN43_00330 [bacterium]|nr:hypothetical protein [bacterium]
MPVYKVVADKAKQLKVTDFKNEKALQSFVEKNLEEIFNCRFVASEFHTGAQHSGRIDTLALSEDNNPVIIEYKIVESSELVNQSLFYMSWIKDHKGDYQIAVEKTLGKKVEIDWGDIRVICIAPGYKRYDLHAVKMIGANVELWEYKLLEDGVFVLEEVFRKTSALTDVVKAVKNGKNPVMVAAGKKAAQSRLTGEYSFEEHLKGAGAKTGGLLKKLREYIMEISDSIEEAPKKYYVAYKTTKNFVCLEARKKKLYMYLRLNPKDLKQLPANARDVREIGHFGTGDLEYTVREEADIEEAKKFIMLAYKNSGG